MHTAPLSIHVFSYGLSITLIRKTVNMFFWEIHMFFIF